MKEFYQGDIIKITDFKKQIFVIVSKNAFIKATGIFHICPVISGIQAGPLHIPVNGKNNLTAMSASLFGSLFRNRRMSRQRISAILSGKHPVERFDLITLLFFIYAQTVEPDWPAERYLRYIDGINEILARCHMQGIYPANPYEAFVLMCIVTECPLDVYAEVWEMSFKD